MIVLANAHIVTAFNHSAIGSRVIDRAPFLNATKRAIAAHDFSKDRVPGQALLDVPEAVPHVSAGVGPRSTEPEDYVLREHRGQVTAYLKRTCAAKVESCKLVVYTREAYLRDPDIDAAEASRIDITVGGTATHVLVAVLAAAGPESPHSPYRFVWNLAGGNREAATWTTDEIRAKAKAVIEYDKSWAPVAD
jgi:hypothetical protein